MKRTILVTVLSIFLLVIVSDIHTNAQGIMTTYAGTSFGGYSGDGGPAKLAELAMPEDICMDVSGNLYIVDYLNVVIRKVSATTGIISTIGGDGTFGYFGDGGPATDAQFRSPRGICLDGTGNIYVSDMGNNVIRKIMVSTGTITTYAGNGTSGFSGDGGPATAAMLNLGTTFKNGICADMAGNLYIVDNGNNRIRKVNTDGIISTIAGTVSSGYSGDGGPATAASLFTPFAICVAASGDLYFSDQWGSYIRKIGAASGIIKTIAGNGFDICSGDGGPAATAGIGIVDGICIDDAGNIYIDDASCSCRKISQPTGIINTIAGNDTASGYNGDGGSSIVEYLHTPGGLCVDSHTGEVFIADAGNNRIRKTTQTGYSASGINNISTTRFSIYPNPSTGAFIVQTTETQKNAQVEICNIIGEVIYKSVLNGLQNSIDLSNYPVGNYFIKMSSQAGLEMQKITLAR